MKRVAFLLSGRGSNFKALHHAIQAGQIPAETVMVISNREDAPGLAYARSLGLPCRFVESRGRAREDFDREVVEILDNASTDIVCLAGFMRLLSDYFVHAFPSRILNIHPSLLPAFPGLNAQKQALEWGVKITGCTVHFVDDKLDHGPIIVQRVVPVLSSDDEETLSARILEQEHLAYPEALKLVCEDRISIQGRRVIVNT
ncbi:MAG TPA: phosphoribosylglycinamide formyltransferase [Acidobacteriota bacterium]|nr:phosphoribosylglycinamide formyltransferase [Acidobacteriota bacterium]